MSRSKKFKPTLLVKRKRRLKRVGPTVVLHRVNQFDKAQKKRALTTYLSVLKGLLSDLPDEVSAPFKAAIAAEDWVGLIDLAGRCRGAEAATMEECYSISQVAAFVKKYPFPVSGLAQKATQAALDKFLETEQRCQRYNRSFRSVLRDRTRRVDLLDDCRRWITKVIGSKPNLGSIYALCKHGPGASVGVHGENTNFARKFLSEEWTCTPSALPYAISCFQEDHHVYELLLGPQARHGAFRDPELLARAVREKAKLVWYNKITTVPKTAVIDRTIAIEPLLNGYLQLGVGQAIALYLRRVGIDIRDQTRNRLWAGLGSVPSQVDPFVTIDLSSASDSIVSAVLWRILPRPWSRLLWDLRSPSFRMPDGTEIPYQKLTSMGNGFCFPLETLIFASVCARHAAPRDFTVYGDDIIVRQSVAAKVINDLWRLGFRHNPKKTFLSGPFRESCGADWFEGRNVRPLELDYELDSLTSLIKFHNATLRNPLWEAKFASARELVRSLVPRNVRLCRPYEAEEDGAFQVEHDAFLASAYSEWDRDIQAWVWYELEPRSIPDKGASRHDRFQTVLAMFALRGGTVAASQSETFSKRRKTVQRVVVKGYAGSRSTWLPSDMPRTGM